GYFKSRLKSFIALVRPILRAQDRPHQRDKALQSRFEIAVPSLDFGRGALPGAARLAPCGASGSAAARRLSVGRTENPLWEKPHDATFYVSYRCTQAFSENSGGSNDSRAAVWLLYKSAGPFDDKGPRGGG